MKACLFQNGKRGIVELAGVTIPVMDSSFLFGDGVYEVIAVVDGQFFDLEPHLERLASSLAVVGIPEPMSISEMRAELNAMLAANGVKAGRDGYVYLQVSRDVQTARDFAIGDNNTSSFFAYYGDKLVFTEQAADEAETSIIFPDIRWALKHVKTTQLMASRMAKRAAAEYGALEPIYISADGIITEGGSTNIFIVKDGVIFTHPKDNAILWGITRQRVIELAKRQGYKLIEEKFSLEEMLAADELFRTSTTIGVRGIGVVKTIANPKQIFGHVADGVWEAETPQEFKIGSGLTGKVTQHLAALYKKEAYENANQTAEA